MEGQILGDYQIIEQIGQGTTGQPTPCGTSIHKKTVRP